MMLFARMQKQKAKRKENLWRKKKEKGRKINYNTCHEALSEELANGLMNKFLIPISKIFTVWKVSKYGAFYGPYFLVFGLNTE